MAKKIDLSNILKHKWEQHKEAPDCIVGYNAIANATNELVPYTVIVSNAELVPGVIALQNAAAIGYAAQQKLLAANDKLQKELEAANAKVEDLRHKLESAEERAAIAAADSISSLFQ